MLPEKFDRYEVLSLLGDGAMGRVYKAFDPLARRTVAIKTMKSEYLGDENRAEYLRRFQREAQAAGVLSHPAIVTVFDVGEGYFVMEFVEGTSLQARLTEKGHLGLSETQAILAPVAAALDYAHARGVVHRDVKPANIVVGNDGRPKLLDFGVAHLASSVMTATGQFLGSPAYMAPEQIADGEVGPRSDVFSLAVVAYEMLTGHKPFDGKNISTIVYKVVNTAAPPPRQWNGDLPERYDQIFEKALAKDPSARYPSAGALVGALSVKEVDEVFETLVASGTEAKSAPAPPPPEASVSPPKAGPPAAATVARGRLPLLLGAAAVALVGAFVAWSRAKEPATPAPAVEASLVPATLSAEPAAPPPSAAEPSPVPPTATPVPSASPVTAKKDRAARPPSPTPVPVPEPTATPATVAEGDFVPLGPGVTPPVRISGSPAPYPPAAQRAAMSGTVAVDILVDEKGAPTQVDVVESGGKVLDDAVVKAVKGWRFEPATKDGVRVKTRWRFRQIYK